MIKFDMVSDLHVDAHARRNRLSRDLLTDEHGDVIHIDWKNIKNADSSILTIAGDISNQPHHTMAAVRQAANEYDHVMFVLGNHDFYASNMTVSETMNYYAEEADKLTGVTLLDENTLQRIENTLFIGTTLWYTWDCFSDRDYNVVTYKQALNAWNNIMNDKLIKFDDNELPDVLGERHRNFLVEQVKNYNNDPNIENIVIVTHMVPSVDLVKWAPFDMEWNSLTPSYVNHNALKKVAEVDTNKKVKIWSYGHTHYPNFVELEGIQCVNSARGYPGEGHRWIIPQFEL